MTVIHFMTISQNLISHNDIWQLQSIELSDVTVC